MCIEKDDTALKRIYNSLKKSGYFVLHDAQKKRLSYFKIFDNFKIEGKITDGYDPRELRLKIERCGFKIRTGYNTFGKIGRLCWELNQLVLMKCPYLTLILLPPLKLLAYFDVILKNKQGSGILIIAQK